MIEILVSSMLMTIAGVSMATMYTLLFHYDVSIFKDFNGNFWNPQLSWNNKWKKRKKENGEAFFLSSTVLVFTTDAFHLFQFFFLNSLFVSMYFVSRISGAVNVALFICILCIYFKAVFEIFFKYVLIKKKTK